MKRTVQQWKAYYLSSKFRDNYIYAGDDLGAVWTKEKTKFRIWCPSADAVVLNMYRSGDGESSCKHIPMEKDVKGTWFIEVDGDCDCMYYDYSVSMDGKTELSSDPYAKACGLNGKRSMVINLASTDPEGWESDRAPKKQSEDIIYELHVKEFSWDPAGGFPENVRGTYQAFQYPDTTLNHDGIHPTGLGWMKNIGVTHVQLMPVFDYGSVDEKEKDAFNWGYDPLNYNVPEGSYSSDPRHGEVRIRELKEAVQALHKQGFRVIMDVVYNHTYSLDSCFQKTAPWYYYRTDELGAASNGSACGNDLATEREMCAQYIVQSVLYWAEEYHMDGFRFDLMGLLDVQLMNRIQNELDQRFSYGEKLIYGEPWAADRTAMEDGFRQALKVNFAGLDKRIGMFSDDTRDLIKGDVFIRKNTGYVNGKKKYAEQLPDAAAAWCMKADIPVEAPSQIISYVSAHDNLTLWDKLCETTISCERRRREYRLAAGIYICCQGRLFLLSGEEFLRTKNGIEDAYCSPISVNRLDWARAWAEAATAQFYKGLFALRKQLPGLCDKSETAKFRIQKRFADGGLVGFTVDNRPTQGAEGYGCQENASAWDMLYLIYNSGRKKSAVLDGEGWELLADQDNSFLWENPQRVKKKIEVDAVGFSILGRRNA